MERRRLGRTGLSVSPFCLGAMMFGKWGNQDRGDCVRTIHAALDAGINFVDTADVYSAGESEEIVGEALKGRRDRVILATKVHGAMGEDDNQRGNGRRWILEEVENSLRRLGTDYIDLYQVHRPEPDVAIEETLEVLTDLVRAGKVRYIGSSTFPASHLVEAQVTSDRRGLARFACEQPPYSIMTRGVEADVLPTCARYGVGVIPWSPLDGGWLTGKYRAGQPVPEGTRGKLQPARFDPELPANRAKSEVVEGLVPLAEAEGLSLTQLALAWVIEHPAVTAAIIGPRNLEQLQEQLPAAGHRLSPETLDRIDQLVPPGTNVNPADAGWAAPWMAPAARRRQAAG